jgi:hypothetical protein
MQARHVMQLLAACLPALLGEAHAANWLEVFGNESPDAPHFRPVAILQPTYTYIDADPVSGLQGPLGSYNGQYTFNNRVQPNFEAPRQFQFMRARLGARGKLTDKINYFALIEAGSNPMTAQRDVILSALSLTFNHLPGARIRAGLFRLPTDEEAMVAVHNAYSYTYFSTAVQNLLIEQPVQYTGPTVNPTLSNARAASGCNCFHDWGIQVYDWFNRGKWEFSYAAMLSNGGEIDNFSDQDNNKDLTLRLQASRVFGGKGPNRQDFSIYLWRQDGERRFGAGDHDRIREGLGFKLSKGKGRLSGSWLRGDGMIIAGFNPPFPDNPIAVGADEKADGWYLEGGWRFHPKWEVDLRQDGFMMMTENPINTRELTTTTLGLQHFLRKDTRISFNYEWRDMKVPHPLAISDAAPQYQRSNALAIAGNLGDRASLQLTWFY